MNNRGNGRRIRLLSAALALCVSIAPLIRPAFAAGPGISTGISLYDALSVDGSVTLHTEFLESVQDAGSAAGAVSRQVNAMTEEQKKTPADMDQAVLFAEASIAAAGRTRTGESVIHLSKETIGPLAEKSAEIREEVAEALRSGGVSATRKIANTVLLETVAEGFTLVLHADILETAADKIRVAKTTAPAFAVTLRPSDFREDLLPVEPGGAARTLSISVRMTAEECEPGTSVPIPKVQLDVPDGQLSAPVTLSLHPGSNEPSSLTIEGKGGEITPSKYNPASRTLDARLDASDVYTFGRSDVRFTDLTEKNRRLRAAVEALAKVNVVYGYPDNTFRPDQSVTRAEFVAFVMRALGRVNNSLKSPFVDVTEGSGCYHEIASAYYYGIIKGYDAEHFRGERLISRTQIYAILGRILESEMGYWKPENPAEYLSREFSDTVDEWAQGDIALATREGLVIRQDTGRFDGQLMMNRGDVALIIYGLYQRLM